MHESSLNSFVLVTSPFCSGLRAMTSPVCILSPEAAECAGLSPFTLDSAPLLSVGEGAVSPASSTCVREMKSSRAAARRFMSVIVTLLLIPPLFLDFTWWLSFLLCPGRSEPWSSLMSLDCDRAGESSSRVYWFLPFFLCDLFLSFRVGGGGGAGSTADTVSGLGREDGGGCAGSATCGATLAFSTGDGGFVAGSLGGTGTAVVRVTVERAANGISSEGSESASTLVLADIQD
jgi:hypothetical protein